MIKTYANNRIKRHVRIRSTISGTASRPRLSVFRSNAHIYAQLIDDLSGKTLAQASDATMKEKMTKTDKAKLVGKNIATSGKAVKITKVIFDRGGFSYHGRVKALADAAREGGLEF